MVFVNLGFKDLQMNNFKLNFIVYEQIYIVMIIGTRARFNSS